MSPIAPGLDGSNANIAEPIASTPSGSSLESLSISLSKNGWSWGSDKYADGVLGTGSAEESEDGELEDGDEGCVESVEVDIDDA